MSILLCDPPTQGNINLPNIGLGYLAATLPSSKVVDLSIRPTPADRYLQKADIFGISIKANTFWSSVGIFKKYRELFRNTRLVAGGMEVTMNPSSLKEEGLEDVDIILGEGEYLNNSIRCFKNLDDIPFPNYEAFDSWSYIAENFRLGSMNYPLTTSRGCPYRCTFCCTQKFCGNRLWRTRSVDNCYREIKRAKDRYSIKGFEILDDNFTINKKRVLNFCQAIEDLELNWFCYQGIRCDKFDEEMADSMFRAGCKGIAFGIENISQEILDYIKKDESIETISQAIQIARDRGFHTVGYFIIGLPGSSYELDLESLRWARKMKIKAHFSYLVPFKGTEIVSQIEEKEGKILADYRTTMFFGERAKPIIEYPNYKITDMVKIHEDSLRA